MKTTGYIFKNITLIWLYTNLAVREMTEVVMKITWVKEDIRMKRYLHGDYKGASHTNVGIILY